MLLGRSAAPALVLCAGAVLGGCVADPAPTQTAVMPVAAVAAPASGWQWSDVPAGPNITLNATDVAPAAGARMVSLVLTCNDRVPAIAVTWDAPVTSTTLTYRFAGQPDHNVPAQPSGTQAQIVSDPVEISRFLDEASVSQQLVIRAGASEATFSTIDDAGNLKRFRTACPSGTN